MSADPAPTDIEADTLTDAGLAASLVRSAGRLAARMLRDGLRVEEKTSISDVVSTADRAAEALIVERLAATRPGDGVVGEEGSAAPGRRTWVIDPVDGTYNFVSGLPAWCSALALVDGPVGGVVPAVDPAVDRTAGPMADRAVDPAVDPVVDRTAGPLADLAAGPLADRAAGPTADLAAGPMADLAAGPMADLTLGAIYQPTTDELWVGGPAVAPTLNGVALPPLADRDLREVAITTYLHPPRLLDPRLRDGLVRAIGGAATVRIVGSGSIELAAVAAGRLGVWLHADPPLWDWLPGAALVVGVGGATEIFEYGGHRWHAAGPPTAVAQVRSAVLGEG